MFSLYDIFVFSNLLEIHMIQNVSNLVKGIKSQRLEMYHLISSFCLQKAYHSHQKQEISKARRIEARAPKSLRGGGWHVPGPCPPPHATPLLSGFWHSASGIRRLRSCVHCIHWQCRLNYLRFDAGSFLPFIASIYLASSLKNTVVVLFSAV